MLDSPDFTDKFDDVIKDVAVCSRNFAKKGSKYFEYCSKRKIIALTHMASWMFDERMSDIIYRKTNPSKIKRIQKLIRSHKKHLRKIANYNVSMHALVIV